MDIKSLMTNNRVKSLLWRAGMMGLAAALATVVQNLSSLEIPGEWVTLIGLILGEVSKYLNTKAKT
jgi:hypothetical protein